MVTIPTDLIAGMRQHTCWTYESDEAFRVGLAGFVREGLAAGDRIVGELSEDHLEQARRDLRVDVPQSGPAEHSGALILRAASGTYLQGGVFEPDLRLASLTEMAERAVADGHRALRILGEAADVKGNPDAVVRWPGYELRCDLLCTRVPITAVCAYDARRCRGEAMSLLRSVHAQGCGSAAHPVFTIHAGGEGGLSVGGEIDLTNAETLTSLVRQAAPDLTSPVVDLGGLRFVDVVGMRAVRAALHTISESHGRAEIRAATPMFQRLWAMMFREPVPLSKAT